MEAEKIRVYAKLMEELKLTGFELEEAGARLRLERNGAPAVSAPAPVEAAPQPAAVCDDVVEVRSPMVGVFYTGPAENAAPFVLPGSHVKKGDVLCIIEAMKLMNEITAEWDGVITEVGCGNNQVVDFGHVLFRMRKEQP